MSYRIEITEFASDINGDDRRVRVVVLDAQLTASTDPDYVMRAQFDLLLNLLKRPEPARGS